MRAVFQTLPWSQWVGLAVFLYGVALLVWGHRIATHPANEIKWLWRVSRDRIQPHLMIFFVILIGAIIGGTLAGLGYWIKSLPPLGQQKTENLEAAPSATPVAAAVMVSSEPIEHKKGLVIVPPSPVGPSSDLKDGDFNVSVLQYYYSQDNNQLVANLQFANNDKIRRTVTRVIFTSWSDYMLPDERRVLDNSNPLMSSNPPIHVEPGAPPVVRTFLQTISAEGFKAVDKFGLEVTTAVLNGGNNFTSIDLLENGAERLQKPIEEVSLDEPWDKRNGRIRSASSGATPPDRTAYSTMPSSKLKEVTEEYIQRLRKFDLRFRGAEYKAILIERERIRKKNPPAVTAMDQMNMQMRGDYKATNRREGLLRDNFQALFNRDLLKEAELLNEVLKKKLEPDAYVESQKKEDTAIAVRGRFMGTNAIIDLIDHLDYLAKHLRPD